MAVGVGGEKHQGQCGLCRYPGNRLATWRTEPASQLGKLQGIVCCARDVTALPTRDPALGDTAPLRDLRLAKTLLAQEKDDFGGFDHVRDYAHLRNRSKHYCIIQ